MANNGQQSWAVLNQIYLDDSSLTGYIMPNIQYISPDAIVPSTATITFNVNTSPAPTGGVNGDIWYNFLDDNLYKKISGTWTLLTNRVFNDYYIQPSGSVININNTTTNFVMSYVKVLTGVTVVFSKTNVNPGGYSSNSLAIGTYTLSVKVLPSSDGGSGVLSLSSNGTVTNYSVPSSGITVSQTATTPIIVQLSES